MSAELRDEVVALTRAFAPAPVPEGFRRIAITSEEGVRDALLAAGAARRRTYVVGGGTLLGGIPAPRAPGDVLDLSALRGVVAHEVEDLTITVRAGETLADLDRRLAEHGQCVALHADDPERATVGGVVAAGLPARHELRHGTVRDQVLGVTAILCDGTRSRSGGRLVKNVTGYDLPKLFVGSRGTIGVLTEVSLRCRARPAAVLVGGYAGQAPETLDAAARHARDARASTVDLLDARAAQALGLDVDAELLLVRWEGDATWCAHRRDDLEKRADAALRRATSAEGDDARALARRLDALRSALADGLANAWVLAAHALPGETARLREALRATSRRSWSEPCLGTVRAFGSADGADPQALLRALGAPGVHAAFEQAPPAWRSHRHPRPADVPGAAWMTRLKRAFDPDGLLWPGAWPEAEIPA